VDETPSSEDKRLFNTTTVNNVRNNPRIFCPKCDQRMLKSRLDDHLKIHYKNKIIPKWISRKCQKCGSIYHVHKDWLRFSKLCKSCNNDKNSNKKEYTNYAQASFDRIQGWGYQGGSPGLGKKR